MAKGSRSKVKIGIEIDGEVFQISVISPGKDITETEKIDIAKVVCLLYQTDRYSLDECLKECGVKSRVTWYSWVKKIEQIEHLYLEAQRIKDSIYRHNLRERGRTMAERLLEGYTVEVLEREVKPGKNKDGEDILETVKMKRKEIYIRPSAAVLHTILFNTDSSTFEKNPKPIEKASFDVDIPPIEWVTRGQVKKEKDGGKDK